MNLKNALAQSINIPAVKLLYLTGIDNSIQTAKMMGISSLGAGKERYGLTFHKIGEILGKNDRTIWTVYDRARKKIQRGDPVGK